jgi:hypothetical protein
MSGRSVPATRSVFVRGLRGDEVSPDQARRLLKLEPTGKRRGTRRSRKSEDLTAEGHSRRWLLPLDRIDYDEADQRTERKRTPSARKKLESVRRFEVTTAAGNFGRWCGQLRKNDRVIAIWGEGRTARCDSPARVLQVEVYPDKGKRRGMLFLESRRHAPRRTVATLSRAVGRGSSVLVRPAVFGRLVRNRAVRGRLEKCWLD